MEISAESATCPSKLGPVLQLLSVSEEEKKLVSRDEEGSSSSFSRIDMSPFSYELLINEMANKALFWKQHNYYYYGVNLTQTQRLLVAPPLFDMIDFAQIKEEYFYLFDNPIKCTRVHGLAYLFDILFDTRNRKETSPSIGRTVPVPFADVTSSSNLSLDLAEKAQMYRAYHFLDPNSSRDLYHSNVYIHSLHTTMFDENKVTYYSPAMLKLEAGKGTSGRKTGKDRDAGKRKSESSSTSEKKKKKKRYRVSLKTTPAEVIAKDMETVIADCVPKLDLTDTKLISCEKLRLLVPDESLEHILKSPFLGKFGLVKSVDQLDLVWPVDTVSFEKYLTSAEEGEYVKSAVGYFRDQFNHLLCWCYVASDLVSASRVINKLVDCYKPLCVHYLCQNIDKVSLSKPHRSVNEDENDGVKNDEDKEAGVEEMHRCYGADLDAALYYIREYGIPYERAPKFDCCVDRVLGLDESLFKISSYYRYANIEPALERLKTHPVGALLHCFSGWDTDEVYRGPLAGNSIKCETLHHGVTMVRLIKMKKKEEEEEIEELVVECKNSTGTEFIYVSLGVMFLTLGVSSERVKDGQTVRIKPSCLLSDFYSVDVEYDGELSDEQKRRIIENRSYKIPDGELSQSYCNELQLDPPLRASPMVD